jgi:hypothetical protein
MAFTIDQYNTLIGAIAQGALKVKYADKEVEYRSLSDMIRVKQMMETELGLNPTSNGKRVYAEFKTGLHNGECNR